MGYKHSRNFLVTKKNEIMLFVGKWIQIEINILCKLGQFQKDRQHLFPLNCGSQILQRHKILGVQMP